MKTSQPAATGSELYKASRIEEAPATIQIIDNLAVGGAQRLLLTLAEIEGPHLPFRVLDLSGRRLGCRGALDLAGVETIDLEKLRLTRLRTWIALYRILKAAPEPIVHLHLSYSIIMAAPMAKLAGKRVVVTLHTVSGKASNLRAKLIEALVNFSLRRFTDQILACGDEVMASWKNKVGQARMSSLPNAIPRAPIVPAGARAAKRAELGVLADTPVILFAGRIEPEKDPFNLLAAMLEVVTHRPEAVLWIAGEGGLRTKVEAGAATLGLSDSVRFLGVRNDVAHLMTAADVFVLSSAREGLPLALLEAMSLGLPAVATATGDTPRVIGSGGGLLVEPSNPRALADALLRLLSDRSERERIGEEARRAAESFSDVRAWKARLARIYAEVLRAP